MRAIGESKIVTARKNYGCGACEWLNESGLYREEWFMSDLTFSEKRVIARAHINGWRIMKGEPCHVQTVVSCDGKDILHWRARPDIHALNIKYDMYQEVEVC